MLLTRFEPFKGMQNFHRIIDNYPIIEENRAIKGFVPNVNTREGEFAYHIDIDLPGMNKNDISIDIDENSLIISGERKIKEEVKEEDYHKIETSFGKFERVFSLPKNIDIENITASSQDGVLEIVIPKQEKMITKKQIKIK
ncbi:Hsp20/alpha crystallin family protein [Arcobacter sp. 15-2]|uniref:Hsp20/alpha crystallin family protein n=1 Tax=Arcobacter sp. 15-2 TaxID=3374109 RepID=UPI00399D2DEF